MTRYAGAGVSASSAPSAAAGLFISAWKKQIGARLIGRSSQTVGGHPSVQVVMAGMQQGHERALLANFVGTSKFLYQLYYTCPYGKGSDIATWLSACYALEDTFKFSS
jgi:hypothetical protein